MAQTSRPAVGIFLALALLVSACNSSAPTSSNPPPGGGNNTPVQSATVRANANNTFSPGIVNLLTGGTVTFSNSGGGLHNVNSGAFRCAQGCDGEGGNGAPSTASWSFTRTFPTAGTVNYVCDEHASAGMSGQIVVQ